MEQPKKRKLWEKIVMGAVIGGAIGSVVGGAVGGDKKTQAEAQPQAKPKKRSIILRVLGLLLSRKKKIPHEDI